MEDASTRGWAKRAACRWVIYSLLWAMAFVSGLLSAYHPVMQIVSGILGCLLAVSLPITFATLFEITYARGARIDLPVIFFPWLGSIIVGLGMCCLLQSSSFLVALFSSARVDSAQALNSQYAGKSRHELPHTICIGNAFVKTDWEAGKLRCETEHGHIQCAKAYVAAPIFNNKNLADAGKAEEIYAWAVTAGRHVDANYRRNGELCGYLNGMDMDYHASEFRLAILRLINKHALHLGEFVGGLDNEKYVVPLDERPLLLTADPAEVTHIEQACLVLALVLLCFCPCAGPVPIGALLLFACWAKRGPSGNHHHVAYEDDYDVENSSGNYGSQGNYHVIAYEDDYDVEGNSSAAYTSSGNYLDANKSKPRNYLDG